MRLGVVLKGCCSASINQRLLRVEGVIQLYVASIGIKHPLSFAQCVYGKAARRDGKTGLNWKRGAEGERKVCRPPNPLSCESFLEKAVE
jgi:hypothetical protein